MESLQLRSALSLPSSPTQEFPFSRSNPKQAFVRTTQCWRSLQQGHRIGTGTVLVRARGGRGDDDAPSSVGVPEEERPLWQRAWRLGATALGFGETWKEDPRGQRELEELDSFLEGRVDFRWKDVLDPSVENVLALVLTGLFLYAIALIGWQLLLVAAAITLSALKYAVIAAIVLGVLIFFI